MRALVMTYLVLLTGGAEAASNDQLIEGFEGDGFGNWQIEGSAFGDAPVPGRMKELPSSLKDYAQQSLACSAHGGIEAKGALTSAEITLPQEYLAFLVAGGNQPGKTAVQLLVDGEVKREALGENSLRCRRVVWDVSEWRGRKVRIRLIDDSSDEWGMIAADHFLATSWANVPMPGPDEDPENPELASTDAIVGATIPPGTSLKIIADYETHGVMSPTALSEDENGKVFVSETHRFRRGIEDDRNHLYWYLDDLAAQTVEDRRACMEKWKDKFKEGYFTEYSEVVRQLSGGAEDGRFENATVFADGFNDELAGTAAGVFAMDGVVYFACIPGIHALADTDGDGVADDRSVVQDGFGVRFSLSGHDLNGFKLGTDGRIYGTMGDRGFGLRTREGVSFQYPNEGAVFRFDPDGTNFEVIHTGLRNPKELAFDEYGNLFSVDNNSDQGDAARIVQIVEGGDSGWRMEHQAMHTFHRQIGLEERPLSRWMNERMWEMANEQQPAYMLPPVAQLSNGPSGMAYHPGTGFLEAEKGRFLICDYKGTPAASGIWSFALEPSGASMKLKDARKLIWGVTATDVTYSWDGRLLVSDFVKGWRTHEEGRILEIEADEVFLADKAEETARLVKEGFDRRPLDDLVELLSHPDMRVRTRAQLALTRKQGGWVKLSEVAEGGEGLARLHAIWGLGIIARRSSAAKPTAKIDDFVDLPNLKYQSATWDKLLPLLGSEDAEVRAQTIKVLGESGIAGDRINYGALFADESPKVRMLAALSAARTKPIGSLPYLWEMLAQNDNQDPYLRHAGAYALGELSSPRQLQALSRHASPALRLAAVIALGKQKSELVANFLKDPDRQVAEESVRMIHDRRIETVRPLVAAMLDDREGAKWSDMVWMRLIHSAYRMGEVSDVERVLSVALDESVPVRIRQESLRLLTEWNAPHPVDQSIGLHDPLPERDPGVAKQVLAPRAAKLVRMSPEFLAHGVAVVLAHRIDPREVGADELEKAIRDEGIPGAARAKLLELCVGRESKGLEGLLVELSGMKNDALALEAMRRLVESGSGQALVAIKKAINSDSIRRQQEGWTLAGVVESPHAATLIREGVDALVGSLGESPVALEVLAVARESEDPKVKEALDAYDSAVAAADDPLAPMNPSLLGGDRRKGGQLFGSHPGGQCMRCHISYGEQKEGMAGPSLVGVANRGDRRFLLASLVDPSAVVATGYGVVSVQLKDGSTVGGMLESEDNQKVVLSIAGETRTIERKEIESMTDAVSSMPPMGALLKPGELRDLVAWLSNLKEP